MKRFFTKFAKHQIYIHIEGCHPQNSTHIRLASRFLDFFGNDEIDPIMIQNDREKTKKSRFRCNFCQNLNKHRGLEC